MATDLAVRIATILDATGLNKADQAVGKFEKNLKSLGKTLGVALSGAAITAYGKAAVKAFAADEAAAQRLATAVSNIGLSLFTQDVEDFIAKTERSAGILDDKLRPAMQALITTTGSFTQSQELLNDAITISRASGVDLTTVAQDLANGYVGITKGLKKYNTGLTQTELKTKSFSEVLGILLKNSAGAADAYLETTSYKMDSLAVAAANAQEKIGEGLMDALAILGGGNTTKDAMKAIDNIAEGINKITKATAYTIAGLTKVYKALDWITSFGGITGSNGKIAQQFGDMPSGQSSTNRSSSPAGTWNRTRQQREAEAEARKRAKELELLQKRQIAAQKALTAEQKKQAALKKAGSIFDMEQIQIIAALKGNISEDERLRLKLQLALTTENETEAAKLTAQLANAQDKTGNLAKFLTTLPDANNPFKNLELYLNSIYEEWKKKDWSIPPVSSGAPVPSLFSGEALSAPRSSGAGITSGGDVYITVQGNVVSQEDLESMVLSGLQGKSLSGSPSVIGRISGMFG